MAVIQITSAFGSVDSSVVAKPVSFFSFGLVGRVLIGEISSTQWTTTIGGTTPQTDRVTGTITGTGLSLSTTFGVSVATGGTVTGLSLTYRDLIFKGNTPGPNGQQDTTITVTGLSLPATDIDFIDLSTLLLRINSGSDRIFGSQLVDIIAAGTGDDEVYAFDGNDTVYGGAGNDFIVGENGDDLLFGNEGSDWIIGGAGTDFLVGGAGFDTLIGGDGDDGIVFDPNDNLAGYDGGNGFDTLFIDFASGGNPFSVNLAAQGFEQAIITRNDTDNLPWAQIITVYDSAWRVSKYDFVQDDGSKSVWYQDVDSSRPWRELRDYFTFSGALDFQQVYNDDGTTLFVDFDLGNQAQWSIRRLLTDASGAILSDSYVADALEVRHELFKAPVKASALPDGGIL